MVVAGSFDSVSTHLTDKNKYTVNGYIYVLERRLINILHWQKHVANLLSYPWLSELMVKFTLKIRFFFSQTCAPSRAPGWPDMKYTGSSVTLALTAKLNTRGRCNIWCGQLQTDPSIRHHKMVNEALKAGKFCHNCQPRHSRDNKKPPAISIYSFQGSWGCNNRRWWSAELNGISLLSPASHDRAVLESRPTMSDWCYKGKRSGQA